MLRRTLIEIVDDDYVRFISHCKSGDIEHACNLNDWKAYGLKLKFIELGCDEKEVDELYSLGYSEGSNDAEESYVGEEY